MNNNNKKHLSVGDDIKALALINIEDIFGFTLTAKDSEIEDRYGSEEQALAVAEKYMDIAKQVSLLEASVYGWSMKYSQPVRDSEDRKNKTAYFYTCRGGEEGDGEDGEE